MEKKRNVQRVPDKKRNRPKVRFNIWMLIIIFSLSFLGCFILYMIAANVDDDFFRDEFENKVIVLDNSDLTDESSTHDELLESDLSETDDNTTKIVNPIPESAAIDSSYLENCCLITDSTLLAMNQYTEFNDIIGNASLNAASVNETKVESNYGTVTVYEALKLKKPMNVYIILGSDIGTSSVDEMIASYTTFISKLKAAIPDTNIYIMQLPPVYADSESITNELINEYNRKLLSLADSYGVYCIDTNTSLKNNDGTISEEYWSEETVSYTEQLYKDICGYILTHTV